MGHWLSSFTRQCTPPHSLLLKSTTVEERLSRFERGFQELKHEVLGLKPRAKGWRQTVGAIPDDELSHNAEKLGREWREQANKD